MTKTAQNILVTTNKEKLAQAACNHFINLANQIIQQKGRFSVALAGGSTPAFFYSLLGKKSHDIRDWGSIHFFWGDERCVPPNHKDSNYFLAKRALFNQISIPANNIHRILTELPPEQAASNYEVQLRSFFNIPKNAPVEALQSTFDLVLLGIGKDGHTASLFPEDAASEEKKRWVVWSPHLKPPPPMISRVSLTLPIINTASQVTFLVSGEEKADILKQIISPDSTFQDPLPAAKVHPHQGDLLWLIDSAAASKL